MPRPRLIDLGHAEEHEQPCEGRKCDEVRQPLVREQGLEEPELDEVGRRHSAAAQGLGRSRVCVSGCVATHARSALLGPVPTARLSSSCVRTATGADRDLYRVGSKPNLGTMR